MKIFKRNQARTEIAVKIRALRVDRHWTQANLSKRLGMSQGRFSEIERGQGSFTAEQFLEILRLFNIPASHFTKGEQGSGSAIQNALARLGAIHIGESPDVLPSERLEEASDVVREALLGAGVPRYITSLAPLLVHNIDRINLNKLRSQFLEYGLERRLAWLIENTLVAVGHELLSGLPRKEAMRYRRAELILTAYLGNAPFKRHQRSSDEALDILDAEIDNEKTLHEVQNSESTISRRWDIATALQPDDFIEALKASRAADLSSTVASGIKLRDSGAGKDPTPDPLAHLPDPPGKARTRNGAGGLSNQIEMDWD